MLVQASTIEELAEKEDILEDRYLKDSQKIVLFLTIFKKLSSISQEEFCAFKKQAFNYIVIRK